MLYIFHRFEYNSKYSICMHPTTCRSMKAGQGRPGWRARAAGPSAPLAYPSPLPCTHDLGPCGPARPPASPGLRPGPWHSGRAGPGPGPAPSARATPARHGRSLPVAVTAAREGRPRRCAARWLQRLRTGPRGPARARRLPLSSRPHVPAFAREIRLRPRPLPPCFSLTRRPIAPAWSWGGVGRGGDLG